MLFVNSCIYPLLRFCGCSSAWFLTSSQPEVQDKFVLRDEAFSTNNAIFSASIAAILLTNTSHGNQNCGLFIVIIPQWSYSPLQWPSEIVRRSLPARDDSYFCCSGWPWLHIQYPLHCIWQAIWYAVLSKIPSEHLGMPGPYFLWPSFLSTYM